ncbi:hypothetical protein D3C87_1339350 [compost metagenome]
MIAAEEFPGAAGAAHDLVMDQEDAVFVADFADASVVAVRRDQRTGRGTADRLHDEGKHAFRAFGLYPVFQHVGILDAALLHRQVIAIEIGCWRRYFRHFPHHRRERIGESRITGDRQRAERAAMIGRKARDHLPAILLAGCDRPLASELQAGFDRLRPTGNEEDLVHTLGQFFGGTAGQFFRRLVFEVQAIGEGHAVHLPFHRLEHVAIAMADIDHHRAAGAVDHPTAILVPEIDALGPVDQRPTQTRLVEQV